MKTTLSKMFLLAAMSALVVSCGKGNSTGGGTSNTELLPGVQSFTDNTISQVNLQTIQQRFEALNTASNGVNVGDVIYHVGPYYLGNTNTNSNLSFNFQVSGCLNLFFTTIGNCNSGSGSQNDYFWEQIISKGSYKVIKSVNDTSVSYKRLVDIDGGLLDYESFTFSKEAPLYNSMLDLDSTAMNWSGVIPSLGSVAKVTLTSGQDIEAYLVEKFDGQHNLKYVVAPTLPLVANPVAILNGYGNFIGGLMGVGQIKIREIKVNISIPTYNSQTTSGGLRQHQFNQ